MDLVKKLHDELAREHQRPPVSLPEKVLVVAAAIAMCAPPWMLGSMTWWAQSILFGLCAFAFLLSLGVGGGAVASSASVGQRLQFSIRCLLRFPLFWMGLIFLVYIAIQALNTDWEYATSADGRGWWMQKKPEGSYISWLPTGMETPFEQMNAWRALLYWAAPWFLLCALWVGVTRRRTARFLLWVLTLNAFAVGLLVIAQQLTGAEMIYWTFQSPNRQFAGPFTYRNHAGAFLYLSMAAPAILLHLTLRHREPGWPGKMVFLSFLLFFIYVAALFTGSRGAMLFGTVYLAMLLAVILFTQVLQGWKGVAVALILPLIMGGMAYVFWPQLSGLVQVVESNLKRTEKQMEGVEEGQELRMQVPKIVWEMVEDNKWAGWGAGSFRYYFPSYLLNHPEVAYSNYNRLKERGLLGKRPLRGLKVYHYAHCDTLQMAAEYGLVMTAFVFLAGGILFFWKPQGKGALVCMILLGGGLLLVFVHSWIDYLAYNPAVVMAATALLGIRPKL